MAKGYRPVERDQEFLLPANMREWLPADHLVWFVLEVVAELDTSALHQRPRRPEQGPATGSRAGRAGYDPEMVLGLLFYAYACSEQSSRVIERRCHTDVGFRVLCAGDVPDHTVLARFRRDHQEAFEGLFAQMLRLCAAAGLGQVGTVSIDGSKFATDAATAANHHRDWFVAAAEREAAERTAAAEATDAAEDALFGTGGGNAAGDRVPPECADPASRAARIRCCREALDAETARARAQAQRARSHRSQRAEQAVEQAQDALARARAAAQDKIDVWEQRWEHAIETGAPLPSGRPPRPVEQAGPVRAAARRLTRAQDKAAHAAGQTAAEPAGHEPAGHEPAGHEPAGHDPAGHEPASGSGKAPVRNLTDPDSRLMKTHRGWVQGYNAQFVVSDDQLVLATRVTQDPFDVSWFAPMMSDAVAAATAIAAARDPEAAALAHGGIETVLADAGYFSEANLTATGPDRLIALGKSRDQQRAARERPTQGDPPAGAGATESMDHRLRTPEGHGTYKRRGATVEPGIGNTKKIFNRIIRRGLAAAQGEITFAATVTNMLKLHRATTQAA